MQKRKLTTAEKRRIRSEALKLLSSPQFFNRFLAAVKKSGLVGEQQNALILLVVAASRLLDRPLNVVVKGHSSSGKNFLVSRVLGLMPKDTVREITSSSERAWNYGENDFRHRVVYLQERNEAAGSVHPVRLLISEGKLIRHVTTRVGRRLGSQRYVTKGPIASISTTTKERLEVDDETRHISVWLDESKEQTRRIARCALRSSKSGLSRHEKRVWRAAHRLLEERVGVPIRLPKWFQRLSEYVYVEDIRARRYIPAFVEACRMVCLIRSYQRGRKSGGGIELDFADFAVAWLIFERVFVDSIHRGSAASEQVKVAIERLNKSAGVSAACIASELRISADKSYRRLRAAEAEGLILRSNKTGKDNLKLYAVKYPPKFLPDPRELFKKVKPCDRVEFIHPITGKLIIYSRTRANSR